MQTIPYKLLLIWANNEDLSLKLKDKRLLELTQTSLQHRSNNYVYKVTENQCGRELAVKYSEILPHLNIAEEPEISEILNNIKQDIVGYCISCNSPLFKEINYDHYVDGYCKWCHADNIEKG